MRATSVAGGTFVAVLESCFTSIVLLAANRTLGFVRNAGSFWQGKYLEHEACGKNWLGLVLIDKVGSSPGCSECHHSDRNSDGLGTLQIMEVSSLADSFATQVLDLWASARPPFEIMLLITAASLCFFQALLCRSRFRWMLWPSTRRIVPEQLGESSNMRQLLHCMIIFVSSN